MTDDEFLNAEELAGYWQREGTTAGKLAAKLCAEVRRLREQRVRQSKDVRQAFIDCLEIVDQMAEVVKSSDEGDKDLPAKWFFAALKTAGDAIASAAKRKLGAKLVPDELLAAFERIGWKKRTETVQHRPAGTVAVDPYHIEPRRVVLGERVVRITGELLAHMLTQGWQCPDRAGAVVRCVKGLPADARLMGVQWEPMNRCAAFVFQSADWEPVPDGNALPEVRVEYVHEFNAEPADLVAVQSRPVGESDGPVIVGERP
jgi:hypothetical protein